MTQAKNTDHIWVRSGDRLQNDAARINTQEPPRPASPCVKVCVIDPHSALCIGCLRSRGEIASWGSLSAQKQIDVLSTLDSRQDKMSKRPRRGGRAAKRKATPS